MAETDRAAPADRAPHFREDAADSANEASSPLSDSTQQKNSPFPFLLPKSGRDRNLLSLPIANGAASWPGEHGAGNLLASFRLAVICNLSRGTLLPLPLAFPVRFSSSTANEHQDWRTFLVTQQTRPRSVGTPPLPYLPPASAKATGNGLRGDVHMTSTLRGEGLAKTDESQGGCVGLLLTREGDPKPPKFSRRHICKCPLGRLRSVGG